MKKGYILFFIILFFAPFCVANATTGTIDATHKYAWSNNLGWINFGCDNCNVQVTNSDITGYAWTDNYGWINLHPDNGGIINNSGTLSGSAWGENTGWIDFGGVIINSQGQFSGTATGDVAGTVAFSSCGASCGVTTTWTPQAATSTTGVGANGYTGTSSGQIQGSNSSSASGGYSNGGELRLIIDNEAAISNTSLVALYLPIVSNVDQVEISNSANFFGATPQTYELLLPFTLSKGNGDKTVYVRFLYKGVLVLNPISANITLNTLSPAITLDKLRNTYTSNENIIISGKSGPNTSILVYFDGHQKAFLSNSKGNWSGNLGRMIQGNHMVVTSITDVLGNMKSACEIVKVVSPGSSQINNNNNQVVQPQNVISPQKSAPDVIKQLANLVNLINSLFQKLTLIR